ncbi:hypothetical protein INR49_014739 [Caranx melampygus]|nr:hypothetical protein INR49_014739 [Caranx melampygus]
MVAAFPWMRTPPLSFRTVWCSSRTLTQLQDDASEKGAHVQAIALLRKHKAATEMMVEQNSCF